MSTPDSSVGPELALTLEWDYLEGDEFHPASNIGGSLHLMA